MWFAPSTFAFIQSRPFANERNDGACARFPPTRRSRACDVWAGALMAPASQTGCGPVAHGNPGTLFQALSRDHFETHLFAASRLSHANVTIFPQLLNSRHRNPILTKMLPGQRKLPPCRFSESGISTSTSTHVRPGPSLFTRHNDRQRARPSPPNEHVRLEDVQPRSHLRSVCARPPSSR